MRRLSRARARPETEAAAPSPGEGRGGRSLRRLGHFGFGFCCAGGVAGAAGLAAGRAPPEDGVGPAGLAGLGVLDGEAGVWGFFSMECAVTVSGSEHGRIG